jgi:hypothetical protein
MRSRFRTVRAVVLVVAVSLIAAACSSDDEDAVAGDAAPTVTETGRSVDAVVEPRVLCVDGDLAFLTYTNTGSAIVEIPLGPENQITDEDGNAVTVRHATVFAPGEQDVLVAYVPVGSTWTLGLGDAQRTLVVDAAAGPACPLPAGDQWAPQLFAPADDRAGSLTTTFDIEHSDDGLVSAVVVTLGFEISGPSRCPTGPIEWTPEAPEIAFGDPTWSDDDPGSDGGPTLVLDDIDPQSPVSDFVRIKGFTRTSFPVDVTDRCVAPDGEVHESWAASPVLLGASWSGLEICFGTSDGDDGRETYTEVDCSLADRLPLTDGLRIRIG